MHVISSFEHSINLELALTSLELQGIAKEHILAIPLDKSDGKTNILDSIHYSDGVSLLDVSAAWATIFSLLGAIYGFVLAWGPIIWGLIGAFVGFCLGLCVDLLISKKRSGPKRGGYSAEVFVLITCEEDQVESVEKVLWNNFALGVAKIS